MILFYHFFLDLYLLNRKKNLQNRQKKDFFCFGLDIFAFSCYIDIMDYKIHQFNRVLSISGIANLHFFKFPQNYKTKEEKHPFYELIYVNSGKLYIQADNYTGTLKKDELLIHQPNENHSLRCSSSQMASVVIIGFVSDTTELFPFSRKPFSLTKAEISKLAEVAKEGRSVFAPPYNRSVYNMKKKKNQAYGNEQLLSLLLESLLIMLIQRLKPFASTAIAPHSFKIHEVIAYLDDNFREKITLDALAFLFQTNRTALCNEFKRTTNNTITQYINQKKLEVAMHEIKNTQKTFTQIAQELNFDTVHYFSSFFTKHTGLSPRDYRNQNEP